MGMLAPSKDLACGLLDSVLLKWQSRGDREHACVVEVEQVNANVEATGGHCAAAEEAGHTPAKVSREQWGQEGSTGAKLILGWDLHIKNLFFLRLLVSVVN